MKVVNLPPNMCVSKKSQVWIKTKEFLLSAMKVFDFPVFSNFALIQEISEDDKKIQKLQEFQIRQMKRDRKSKRIRAYDENDEGNTRRGR